MDCIYIALIGASWVAIVLMARACAALAVRRP